MSEPQDADIEILSLHAGAGSLNLEQGETRIVQVIYESVRYFFLSNGGFKCLDPELESNHLGKGHLSIANTSLDYLAISELDALALAREKARRTRSNANSRANCGGDWAETGGEGTSL